MKILGGHSPGWHVYVQLHVTYIFATITSNSFCILSCHNYKQKTLQITNTEITEKVLAATKACAQKPCLSIERMHFVLQFSEM